MMKFLEDLQNKHYAVSKSGSVLIMEDKLEEILYKAGLLNDDDLNDSNVLCDVAYDNNFYLVDDFGTGYLFAINYCTIEYGVSVGFDIRKYLD